MFCVDVERIVCTRLRTGITKKIGARSQVLVGALRLTEWDFFIKKQSDRGFVPVLSSKFAHFLFYMEC